MNDKRENKIFIFRENGNFPENKIFHFRENGGIFSKIKFIISAKFRENGGIFSKIKFTTRPRHLSGAKQAAAVYC